MRKPSVSIGIPAYNEEANILYIIDGVIKQVEKSYTLQHIIISSDGSTDKTVEKVKSVNDPRIVLLSNNKRIGLAKNQNMIFEAAQSEIVVLVNADTSISDPYFIEKMILPIRTHQADLTSCPLIAISPSTFFEKILHVSMLYKNSVFDEYREGQNLYTCHGPARAFSKRVYQQMRFPSSVGEDAYSYLYCLQHGYAYHYVKGTQIFFKLPDNYADHENQSTRLFQSEAIFRKLFDHSVVKREYKLPVILSLKWFFQYLFVFPVEMISYVFLTAFIRYKSHIIRTSTKEWKMSTSSKMLVRKA